MVAILLWTAVLVLLASRGLGDASATSALGVKSTAKEVVDLFGEGEYLKGKTAIVTGGNSGIGLETCKALASAGARVILCSRSVENANKALKREVYRPGHGGYRVSPKNSNIVVKQLDLADLNSVANFANDVLQSEERVDYLVLNAGVMMYPHLKYTKDDFEYTNACNHYGHFYLTSLLLPKMKRQKHPSRIISVSSAAHKLLNNNDTKVFDDFNFKTTPYCRKRAYCQTKLANVCSIFCTHYCIGLIIQ